MEISIFHPSFLPSFLPPLLFLGRPGTCANLSSLCKRPMTFQMAAATSRRAPWLLHLPVLNKSHFRGNSFEVIRRRRSRLPPIIVIPSFFPDHRDKHRRMSSPPSRPLIYAPTHRHSARAKKLVYVPGTVRAPFRYLPNEAFALRLARSDISLASPRRYDT